MRRGMRRRRRRKREEREIGGGEYPVFSGLLILLLHQNLCHQF
jgi:hypothetical protein